MGRELDGVPGVIRVAFRSLPGQRSSPVEPVDNDNFPYINFLTPGNFVGQFWVAELRASRRAGRARTLAHSLLGQRVCLFLLRAEHGEVGMC